MENCGACINLKRFYEEKIINKRHSGQYIAEIDTDLIEEDAGWSPYLSLEGAQKLDEVRQAIRRADIRSAGRLARVYTPTPVGL